jgi:aromatic-L-amino-acid decarboxylase
MIPLEPDPDQRARLLADVSKYLEAFDVSAQGRLVELPPPGAVDRQRLLEPPGEEGMAPEEIIERVDLANASGVIHRSGADMAYIPNAGLFSGAVAAFLAAGLNRYTGVHDAAPGMVTLEESVLNWMVNLFGLPAESAAGLLLSGGSMANLTAIATARTVRAGDDFARARAYVSPHAHHSVLKAARIAGLTPEQVRLVPVEENLAMSPEALANMVAQDRGAGLHPFLVVASAGTTDTGTIDPLAAVAGVAAADGLWLHVDAAYGGFFQLTERGRKRFSGIELADSITLDPHKGLSIPFGVGALIVRERTTLYEANHPEAAYLQDHPDHPSDFASLGPELTRPARGLLVWLPLQLHGVAAFRRALDDALDLAEYAHRRLKAADWVDRVWSPDLSIVAFQFDDDQRARSALETINRRGEVHMSSTVIDGRYTARLAILNRFTRPAHVDMAIDSIADAYQR